MTINHKNEKCFLGILKLVYNNFNLIEYVYL